MWRFEEKILKSGRTYPCYSNPTGVKFYSFVAALCAGYDGPAPSRKRKCAKAVEEPAIEEQAIADHAIGEDAAATDKEDEVEDIDVQVVLKEF